MICEKYDRLTPIERVSYVGELIHAVMSDNELFDAGNSLINLAILKGLFEGVKILPNDTTDIPEA